MVLAFVFALLFVFGCTDFERANPHDPDGVNYVKTAGESSSSFAAASSSSGVLVWCRVGGYCFENIHAETCLHELHGSLVANCNASSSSSPDAASGSSSSVELASSSSQEVLVSCQVGIDCILEMPDYMCAASGSPVETCEVSSSSEPQSSSSVDVDNSSSVAPSSSSAQVSSSSVAPSSSSHANSSSVAPSSSSETPSSSSIIQNDSSSSGCTASNNTATQYCSNGVMKTYGSVIHDGQTYKTVVIGTQTWMAENLNYAAAGSKCVGESGASGKLVDNGGRCGTYGRLYNWATAMNLDLNCNTSSGCVVQSKHHGICPIGSFNPYGIGKESPIFPIIL
ncbi:MAG: hypothetical protein FWB90_03680 [Fibromonadales bacterium]|nr:hypothetical protein [Fibromonadales bacterium]